MSRERKIIIGSLAALAAVVAGLFLFGIIGGGNSSDQDQASVLQETVEPDYGLLPQDGLQDETTDPDTQSKNRDPSPEEVVNVQDEFASVAKSPGESVIVEESTNTTTVNTSSPQAPSVPPPPPAIGGPSDIVGSKRVSFSISGDVGASFRCSLNRRGFAGAKRCGSTREYTNLSDGEHVFRAWQVTDSGVSAASIKKIRVDTTPPSSPRIVSAPSSVNNKNSAFIKWKGNRKNEFECSLAYNDREIDKRPCYLSVRYRGLRSGKYYFSVKQTDRAGNSSRSASAEWTIDTTPPSPPVITAGPSNGSVSSDSDVGFSFSGEEGSVFRCKLLGPGIEQAGSCVSPRVYFSLGSGEYSFSVRQRDLAGNWSDVSARVFFVELPPASRRSALRSTSEIVRQSSSEEGGGYSSDSNGPGGVGGALNSGDLQEASDASNVTLDVLAAIELLGATDEVRQAAPNDAGELTTGSVDVDVSANLRSNLAWSVESEPAGNLSGSRPLLGALTEDNGLGAEDSGDRNSSNSSQQISAGFNQTISWGDEAGRYTTTVTHTATQSLLGYPDGTPAP